MRKLFLSVICLLTFSGVSYADVSNDVVSNNNNLIASANIPVANPANSVVSLPQQQLKASISQCYDTVAMNSEQLFYLTLAALNTMNFKIKEVQSKTGTVLFQAYSREFLVTIADQGANNTFIKILPTDSNYSFSPALVQNIFGFLKANSGVSATIL